MTAGQNSYDSGASAEAQANIERIAGRLESIIGEHEVDVSAAMAEFTADGVDDAYYDVEKAWHESGNEVREIIKLLRTTLEENDNTANETLKRANEAVMRI